MKVANTQMLFQTLPLALAGSARLTHYHNVHGPLREAIQILPTIAQYRRPSLPREFTSQCFGGAYEGSFNMFVRFKSKREDSSLVYTQAFSPQHLSLAVLMQGKAWQN